MACLCAKNSITAIGYAIDIQVKHQRIKTTKARAREISWLIKLEAKLAYEEAWQ